MGGDMDFLVGPVAIAATITTIALNFTGIQICLLFIRKGVVGEVTCAPFVMGAANAMLWLRYGLLIADSTIVFVNFVGAVLQTGYMLCYYYYATQRTVFYKYILTVGSVVLGIYFYVNFIATEYTQTRTLLGSVCCIFAVMFCAAPLVQMGHVIKTKSTETMSFPLSFATFMMATEWAFYGYLRDDAFVELPNTIGALLGAIQLSLYCLYPASPKSLNIPI